MKKILFSCCLIFIVSYFYSCSLSGNADISQDRNTLISQIDSLQGKMFNKQNMELDKDLAAKGIAAYQNFVKKFPEDSLSAEYLFRLSDISRAMGDHKNAIDYLSRICKDYPTFRKIPDCLFLQGYYYQEYFKDTLQAKNFYVQLVAKYPTHAFTDDAKALMKMFGKSDEDVIKDFEKKDKENGNI